MITSIIFTRICTYINALMHPLCMLMAGVASVMGCHPFDTVKVRGILYLISLL